MEGTFYIQDPGDVICTATITMKLKDWVALEKRIGSEWPGWALKNLITDMVYKAKKEIFATGDNDGN